MKAVSCILAILAIMAAAVAADDATKAQTAYKHHDHYEKPKPKTKSITLYPVPPNADGSSDIGPGAQSPLGSPGVIYRSLALERGGPAVALLWQNGMLVDQDWDQQGLLNYQGTILFLEDLEGFPKGKIFYVGDGTGFLASTPTYYPKSIVGGTEAYEYARGKIVRNPPGGPTTGPAGPYIITVRFDEHGDYY